MASGDLLFFASGLTVSSSSGQLNVTSGADVFPLNAHATEAVSATGLNPEISNTHPASARARLRGSWRAAARAM